MTHSMYPPLPDPSRGILPKNENKGLISANAAPTEHLAQLVMRYSGRHKPIDLKEVLIECEVYADPVGQGFTVHTACPKCRHMQKVESSNKRIDLQRDRSGRVVGIHVEAFTCPWEMTNEADDRKEFGFGLCGLRVEYAGTTIRDA